MLTVNTIPEIEEAANEFVFMDSFETWEANYGRGRWTTAGNTSTDKVRTGLRSLRLNRNEFAIREVNPRELGTHYSVGFATYPQNYGAYSHPLLLELRSDFWRVDNGIPLSIRTWIGTTPTGTFWIKFSTSTGIFGPNEYMIPGTQDIAFDIWNHIGLESQYDIDGSTIVFNTKVYFNEEPIIEAVNLEMSTNVDPLVRFIPSYNSVLIGGNAGGYSYFDDFYIKKGSFPGDLNIGVIRPNGDTDDAGFTPDTGTEGYSRVNDILIDGDTSFIGGTTAGIKSVFTMQDIDPGIEHIYAVQGSMYGVKTAGGGSQLRPIFGQEGSLAGYQSNRLLYPTAGETRHLYYTMDKNPATGLNYTPEEINKLLYGVVKVS